LTGYYVSNNYYAFLKENTSNYLDEELYYKTILNGTGNINNAALFNISANSTETFSLGNYFKSNSKIHSLLQREGDITFEGRFGNSIRFGADENADLPNIKIRAGQNSESYKLDSSLTPIEEDINEDKSSIWLTTNEVIDFKRACTKTDGFEGSEPNTFDSNQIIVNSDRVILNSKANEILLYSNTNIGLSANKNIIINSKKTVVNSKEINLGLNANEQLVLGNTLKS